MTERTCAACGSTFEQAATGRAQRCGPCRYEAKLAAERERYKATRPEPKAQLRTCELCGETFSQLRGAPARWCKPCRPEVARIKAKQWFRDNPDRILNHKSRDPEYMKSYRAKRPPCTAVDCLKPGTYGDGLCDTHHSRLMRTGTIADPKPRQYPRISINAHGYRMVLTGPNARIGEHRLVVEAVLGRPLEAHENVHHKNGIRHDNGLQNLEVWVKPQPSGQRPEDLADWVVEHYPDLVRSRLDGQPTSLF